MAKKEVDEIVLVGGSTRIYKIQELLSEYFYEKPIRKSINPDEAVAYGATLYAKSFSESFKNPLKEIVLIDVVPLSLGIENDKGEMVFFILHNNKLPVTETINFISVFDYQTEISFPVFEGENEIARENHLLGEFFLAGIPAEKEGCADIDDTLRLNNNGILNVEAYDLKSKNSKQINICYKASSNLKSNWNIEKPFNDTELANKGDNILVKKQKKT